MSDADDKTTNPQGSVVTMVTVAPKPMGSRRDACLVMIYGQDIGKRFALGDADVLIGRSSKATIVLDEESVSRNHAKIFVDGEAYVVRDLGSTNGTYVNDQPADSTRLRDGDQVKIGRTIFKFMSGSNVEVQYHEVIYELMTVDGLTEVRNKRYFEETLDREASRCKRYGRTFSVVVFDIDHFKQINDAHGHLAGDAVLRQLGGLLRANVRRDDTAARIGGEEFGVVLPEIPLAGAAQFAEKVRSRVAATDFKFEMTHIGVTISLGVAEFDSAATEPLAIVKVADERLYAAKRGGRNRVVSE